MQTLSRKYCLTAGCTHFWQAITATPVLINQSATFSIWRTVALSMLVSCLNIVASVFTLSLNHSSVSPAIDTLYKATLAAGLTRVLFCRKVGISGACKRTPSKILDSFTGSPSQVTIWTGRGAKGEQEESLHVLLGKDWRKA